MKFKVFINLFFGLFFLSSTNIYSQKVNIDSIKIAMKTMKKDTSYLKGLYFIAQETGYENMQEGERLAKEALTLALKLKWKKGIGKCYMVLGSIYDDERKYDQALACYEKAFILFSSINDLPDQANCNGNRALVYRSLAQFQKSNELHKQALEIYTKCNDKYNMARCYGNIANNFLALSDFNSALAHHLKALKYFEEEKSEKGIAGAYSNIALIYMELGEYRKALDYHLKSLEIRKKMNNKRAMSDVMMNMGTTYYYLGDTSTAMSYFLECKKLREEIGDLYAVSKVLSNLGSFYSFPGSYDKAIDYFEQSLKLKMQLGDIEGIAHVQQNLALLYIEKKKFKEAEKMLKSSIASSQERGLIGIEYEAWNSLSKIYTKTNQHGLAFESYKNYIRLKDSIFGDEQRRAITKKEIQYDFDKKATADSVKNAEEQKVQDAQLVAQNASLKKEKTQRYALYGGLILVLIFLAFVFNRFRITQKQKIIIEQQKQVVDEAFHELAEKNKEIMDSIYYARRIQRALITNENYVLKQLKKLKA